MRAAAWPNPETPEGDLGRGRMPTPGERHGLRHGAPGPFPRHQEVRPERYRCPWSPHVRPAGASTLGWEAVVTPLALTVSRGPAPPPEWRKRSPVPAGRLSGSVRSSYLSRSKFQMQLVRLEEGAINNHYLELSSLPLCASV